MEKIIINLNSFIINVNDDLIDNLSKEEDLKQEIKRKLQEMIDHNAFSFEYEKLD